MHYATRTGSDRQVEMFRFAKNRLKSSIKPALCKEDQKLWKALGMKFDGCHCLIGRDDAIAKIRFTDMKSTKKTRPLMGIGKPLPVLA